ncbi:MAG: ion channel [Alphaproteobacteria bacterium]
MRKRHPSKRPRLIARHPDEKIDVVVVGKRQHLLSKDIYASLLQMSWRRLLILILLAYVLVNLFFAGCYFSLSDEIENARPDSFRDAFFFSVQTLATIGYGKMSPIGLIANLLVTIEAFMGFCFYAMVTGLVFAKFSKPTARVKFSNIGVISIYDGLPHFMIRLANKRGNRIVGAQVHMAVLANEVSKEGLKMRRFYDMNLLRSQVPLLQLTWTLLHPIDEQSPLYGKTMEMLAQDEAEIVISLTGLDETLSQTIHARFSYLAEEIRFNHQFKDILRRREDNRIEINYHDFDETTPVTQPLSEQPVAS